MSLVSIPAAAVNLGSMTYQALKTADISIAMDPEATRDELNCIHRMAVWMGKESETRPYGRIGDLGAVVADNLVLELMNQGYTVYGFDRIKIPAGSGGSSSGSEWDRLLKAVQGLDVQVVVTGNVSAGQVGSLGFFGSLRAKTVVQSLSLKITEVAGGRTLLILTIDYRNGQAPRVAAEGAAIILKAKLDDPQADIKKILDNKNGNGTGESSALYPPKSDRS